MKDGDDKAKDQGVVRHTGYNCHTRVRELCYNSDFNEVEKTSISPLLSAPLLQFLSSINVPLYSHFQDC